MRRSSPESLGPPERRAVERVLELLAAEPASVSSVTDPGRAWEVHVADSLAGLDVEPLAAAGRIADIGSGAGFPGVVLAAALPSSRVELVESVERKCRFIRRALARGRDRQRLGELLPLRGVGGGRGARGLRRRHGPGGRAPLHPGRAGLAAACARTGCSSPGRAAATPRRRPSWPGRESSLAMRAEEVVAVAPFAASRHRHLHVLRKCGPTPERLPRRAGMAKKRPAGARGAAPPLGLSWRRMACDGDARRGG